MKQTIRIIGGQYRGKKLSFIDTDNLRPTPDRVRETLFNWLMHEIRDAICLDAFAGSGALGFEAFSRGAKQVILVESDARVYAHLYQQSQTFQTQQLRCVRSTIQAFLSKTADNTFDIVFYDPPFSQLDLYEKTLSTDITRVLKPHGLLYLEAPSEIQLSELDWEKLKLKQAGQVTYGLYRKKLINEPKQP